MSDNNVGQSKKTNRITRIDIENDTNMVTQEYDLIQDGLIQFISLCLISVLSFEYLPFNRSLVAQYISHLLETRRVYVCYFFNGLKY